MSKEETLPLFIAEKKLWDDCLLLDICHFSLKCYLNV